MCCLCSSSSFFSSEICVYTYSGEKRIKYCKDDLHTHCPSLNPYLFLYIPAFFLCMLYSLQQTSERCVGWHDTVSLCMCVSVCIAYRPLYNILKFFMSHPCRLATRFLRPTLPFFVCAMCCYILSFHFFSTVFFVGCIYDSHTIFSMSVCTE